MKIQTSYAVSLLLLALRLCAVAFADVTSDVPSQVPETESPAPTTSAPTDSSAPSGPPSVSPTTSFPTTSQEPTVAPTTSHPTAGSESTDAESPDSADSSEDTSGPTDSSAPTTIAPAPTVAPVTAAPTDTSAPTSEAPTDSPTAEATTSYPTEPVRAIMSGKSIMAAQGIPSPTSKPTTPSPTEPPSVTVQPSDSPTIGTTTRSTSLHSVQIQVRYDGKPMETSWSLFEHPVNEVVEVDFNTTQTANRVATVVFDDLENGKYYFKIIDSGLDGICCNSGEGWYRIVEITDGMYKLIHNGAGNFTWFDYHEFTLG